MDWSLRIADCCGLRIVTDCGLPRIACFYRFPDYGLPDIGAQEVVSRQQAERQREKGPRHRRRRPSSPAAPGFKDF